MESTNQKTMAKPRISLKTASLIAVAAALVILLIWACISTSNASNMRKKYAASRQSIGEELYGVMYMMALEHEDVSLAGADPEGDVIPTMKEYYIRAQALNSALTNAFGRRYLVMDSSLISQLDQAFAAYDDAFTTGQSTDSAASLMEAALAGVTEALETHYSSDARLKAVK